MMAKNVCSVPESHSRLKDEILGLLPASGPWLDHNTHTTPLLPEE